MEQTAGAFLLVRQVPSTILSLWGVVVMDPLEEYFLPITSTKKVLIGTIFIDDNAGDYDPMMTTILRGIIGSGIHLDALSWGYAQGDGIICIYKRVPLLDVENHLNPD
jgi:hypothetical protein